MKALLFACLVAPLLGQAPLHIVGVERRGLPPYEEGSRLYRLDGGEGSGLKLGDHLTVRRLGGSTLALLKVVELKAEWSLGVLDGVSTEAPMKGDLVLKSELSPLPALSAQREVVAAWPTGPRASDLEAPPREGLIWFLPGSSELSPAGLAKVTGWVEAWGRDGRWSVLVGTSKEAPKALREARGRAIAEALKTMGIDATPALADRDAEGANHPAWVQRRD